MCMVGAAIVGGLWDDIKPFCIDEIYVDGPNRVEDQPNLGKVKTFKRHQLMNETAQN